MRHPPADANIATAQSMPVDPAETESYANSIDWLTESIGGATDVLADWASEVMSLDDNQPESPDTPPSPDDYGDDGSNDYYC